MTEPGSFGNASVIRHLAILAAALTAYLMRFQLRAGNEVLWVLGIAALLNLATFYLGGRRSGAFLQRLSPWFGIGSWTLLAFFTGGISSPFIAGLPLEIVLSAMSSSPRETLITTLAATAALCGQQIVLGASGFRAAIAIWSILLLGMGSVTSLAALRWSRDRESIRNQSDQLRRRLHSLETELSESQVLCKVGENTARLAHGLKNTVHSLRGFTELIEPEVRSRRSCRRAIEGLKVAIDGLEKLTRSTLRDDGEHGESGSGDARAAIEQVTEEVSCTHPSIQWTKRFSDKASTVSAPTAVVREVLLVLLRNAIETMRGRGEVILETSSTEVDFSILVRDHGQGLGSMKDSILLGPVHSTKPGGSGYGLFLARRLLERYGGQLIASQAVEGGAQLSMTLPLYHEVR